MLRSFSIMVNVYFFAFVAFLLSLAFAFSPNNYEITCKSYSWWTLFPLDASIVDPWVPDQFPFIPTASLPAAFHSLPSDKRMVTLEFNKQTDCFSKAAPAIKTTFTEFKVQVPFLNAAKFANKAPLMYKPVIYADNMINAIAGGLQYGLKTVYASPMEYDPANGFYSVDYSDSFIKGSFSNTSDWFPITTLPSSTFAHEYLPLHEQTEWLGHDIWQRTRCAKHYYLWNETKIRWVNANIKFDQGMVGENRAFTMNINGDQKQQLMTAFQIETTHHISGLEKCSGQ